MTRAPNIWPLTSLAKHLQSNLTCGLPDGRWVPARPLGFYSFGHRLRAAWLAFTGQADVLTWDGDQ